MASVIPAAFSKAVSSSTRPAARPHSSASSRRAVSAGSSPSTSRIPAGISSSSRSRAGRYWRTSTTTGLPSASNRSGTTPTAPGERTMSRSNGSPSGSSNDATATRPDVAGVDLALVEEAEPAAHASSSTGSGTSKGMRGTFDSRRPSEAPTSSRNSGWARSGRLLNSGWACVPT